MQIYWSQTIEFISVTISKSDAETFRSVFLESRFKTMFLKASLTPSKFQTKTGKSHLVETHQGGKKKKNCEKEMMMILFHVTCSVYHYRYGIRIQTLLQLLSFVDVFLMIFVLWYIPYDIFAATKKRRKCKKWFI